MTVSRTVRSIGWVAGMATVLFLFVWIVSGLRGKANSKAVNNLNGRATWAERKIQDHDNRVSGLEKGVSNLDSTVNGCYVVDSTGESTFVKGVNQVTASLDTAIFGAMVVDSSGKTTRIAGFTDWIKVADSIIFNTTNGIVVVIGSQTRILDSMGRRIDTVVTQTNRRFETTNAMVNDSVKGLRSGISAAAKDVADAGRTAAEAARAAARVTGGEPRAVYRDRPRDDDHSRDQSRPAGQIPAGSGFRTGSGLQGRRIPRGTFHGYVENRGTGPMTVRNSQNSNVDVIPAGEYRTYELQGMATTFWLSDNAGNSRTEEVSYEWITSRDDVTFRGQKFCWYVWGSAQ